MKAKDRFYNYHEQPFATPASIKMVAWMNNRQNFRRLFRFCHRIRRNYISLEVQTWLWFPFTLPSAFKPSPPFRLRIYVSISGIERRTYRILSLRVSMMVPRMPEHVKGSTPQSMYSITQMARKRKPNESPETTRTIMLVWKKQVCRIESRNVSMLQEMKLDLIIEKKSRQFAPPGEQCTWQTVRKC